MRSRTRGSRFELESVVFSWSISGRQISIEKAERVGHIDYPHTSRALPVQNLIAERLHSRPMHLWPEMMFRVVAVVEPGPVVKLFITAHAPRDRLVGFAAIMPIVSVQIREAVAEIPKRQKKTDVTPVENTK